MYETGKIKIFNLLEIVCLLHLGFPLLAAQLQNNQKDSNSRETESCLRYKKQMFEVEHTYQVFVAGAPEMKYIEDKCKHYDPFVVGGVPALPKEFPPMARIGHFENGKTKWFCGGTLISERYVLTAAHCFYSLNGEVNRVRLGELDFSRTDEEAKPEDFGVKQTIDHPDYNDESSLYNDIGLIELDRSVVFDSFKHPACLPIHSGDEFSEFIAIGWGNTHFFASTPSDILQKVKLDRFSEDQCRRFATRIGPEKLPTGLNNHSQLCAGSSQAKDTCNGDSGGPLLAYHPQFPCMYFVVGVTSAGMEDCGRPDVPGIYTRVYNYMNWIRRYIFA